MEIVPITDFYFDGILLRGPSVCVSGFKQYSYKTFPDNFCGAGTGLGEKLVPDYIFGNTKILSCIGLDISIKISPACFIHDVDWLYSQPTWDDFTDSNRRFKYNIESIINLKARNDFIAARALYRPVTYYNSVCLVGRHVFWSIKAGQGLDIPNNAKQFIHYDKAKIIELREKAGDLYENK